MFVCTPLLSDGLINQGFVKGVMWYLLSARSKVALYFSINPLMNIVPKWPDIL